MPVANCANCGARLPKDGRFCPECGVRTSVENDATAVERVGRRVFATARDRTGFAVEAVSVHSTTRVELFRLRRELSELVAERAEAARALGEAVYVGAEDEIEAGRNRMSELEQALADKEGEMTRVTAAANERIQRAQLQVQPTEVVEPPEVPEPMPAPSE